jgi:hypothetical protein
MTPDEHYLEAENLLAKSAAGGSGSDQDRMVARAHVHAILSTSAAGPQRRPGAWRETTPASQSCSWSRPRKRRPTGLFGSSSSREQNQHRKPPLIAA